MKIENVKCGSCGFKFDYENEDIKSIDFSEFNETDISHTFDTNANSASIKRRHTYVTSDDFRCPRCEHSLEFEIRVFVSQWHLQK